MKITIVANIRTLQANWRSDPNYVYCGRAMSRKGLAKSKWHNPFRVGHDGDRAECIAKFEAYIQQRPDLLAQIRELRGKTLVCWCAPEACHCDVLARLANQTEANDVLKEARQNADTQPVEVPAEVRAE